MNDDYETEGFHFWEWLRSLFVRLDGPSFGAARSPKWPEVRNAFIKENPTCAVCGKKGTMLNPLNAHHVSPFHLDQAKELDPTNLITLCRIHHQWWGHLGKWASWNVSVREDAKIWLGKITSRP